MLRKGLTFSAIAGSYLLLLSILVLLIVAVTSAVADGWRLRRTAAAERDSHPRFSPDGSLIAFLRAGPDEPQQVWVMNDDGTDARPLTRAGAYRWTARGTVLLRRGGRRLFRVEAGGGRAVAAGSGPLPAGAGSAASRRRRVFARGHRIYVRRPDGSVHELT